MLAYFVGLGPLAEYVSLSRRRKGGGSERDFWTACRHFSAFHAIPQGALQLYFILLSMSSASRHEIDLRRLFPDSEIDFVVDVAFLAKVGFVVSFACVAVVVIPCFSAGRYSARV